MSEDRNYEEEARADGWVPEDEWKGDPEKKPAEFVDAKTFVERGERYHGMLKSKVDKLTQEVESLRAGSAEFKKYHDQQMEREAKEREKLISELEQKRATAVEEGDGKTFAETDRQLNDLRSEPTVTEDPLAQQFLADNSWYESNPKLTAFADGVAPQILREGFTGAAYFKELARRVKETFPQDFDSAPKPPPPESGQESDKASDPDPNDRSYDSLPKEAKELCDQFVKTIPGFTREQYVKEYDWD